MPKLNVRYEDSSQGAQSGVALVAPAARPMDGAACPAAGMPAIWFRRRSGRRDAFFPLSHPAGTCAVRSHRKTGCARIRARAGRPGGREPRRAAPAGRRPVDAGSTSESICRQGGVPPDPRVGATWAGRGRWHPGRCDCGPRQKSAGMRGLTRRHRAAPRAIGGARPDTRPRRGRGRDSYRRAAAPRTGQRSGTRPIPRAGQQICAACFGSSRSRGY
jgi:hypothetical protein